MNTRRLYRRHRAPTFRFSDRPITSGLFAAMAIFIACLWIGHGAYLDGEQLWPSRHRGAVSLGTVREQPPPPTQHAATPVEAIDPPPDTPVDVPVAQPRPSVAIRPRSANTHTPAKKPVQKLAVSPRPVAPAAPAAPVDRVAPAAPEIPKIEPPAVEIVTPARPPVVNIEANSAPPVVDTTPRAKTRKEVQDELRKARTNGALPRFGNPDPYGPGGSPSLSND